MIRNVHVYRIFAMDAEEIKIGNVIKQFERQDALIDCEGLCCRLAAVCTLKKALKQGENALFATLNTFTLADLVASKSSMIRLLSNQAA